MVIKEPISNESFFDKNETLDREVREKILFKNFAQKLKTITSLSRGWDKIFSGIDLLEINERSDLEALPVTKKSSFPDLQKNAFPYGELNIKPHNQFPFMFASSISILKFIVAGSNNLC